MRADTIAAEARHAARLNHAGIVTVYDVGREGERLYIVMEYVRGRTLAEVLGDGPIAPLRVVDLLASAADALHYAHKRGFVHRDLKPANILLDESGRPHIADFGLAVTDETQRALAGQVAGTPAYMSPEQCRGAAHHLDGRADIWSLGVIGYELLTGRQPFWHGDALACLDAIQHRDPKPPRQIDDTIPVELERIILKCLAKQPPDRYTTAGDLAADLRGWRKSREARSRRAMERAKADLWETIASRGTVVGSPSPSETLKCIAAGRDAELPREAPALKPVLRWIACAPAAIAAGVASHVVALVGNRLSLEFQFLNSDSVFGKLICQGVSSAILGGVTVHVASAIAPKYNEIVAVVAAGSVLFISGLSAYNVILDSDWWGAYQLVWVNVGSVAAAYAANQSQSD